MKTNIFITALLIIIFTTAINCNSKLPTKTNKHALLLFKSGFEKGVYIDTIAYKDYEDYRFIRGKDNKSGFSWPIAILGAKESALHYIDDDNHKAIISKLDTVIGHNGEKTIALYQKENYNLGVTQCPYEILNIEKGTSDLYIKFWIKMDSISLHKPYMWRTYFEWKSKEYAEGKGFRLISFIYSDENGIPYWHLQGDKDPEHPIWEIDNKSIPVPTNEWFLNEFYWHWSNSNDGIALWKVNGEIIAEYHGATTRNNKSIDFIMIAQIYGNSNPKYQWIDDIEIWGGIPN